MIKQTILDCIGNTPLVRINKITQNIECEIGIFLFTPTNP